MSPAANTTVPTFADLARNGEAPPQRHIPGWERVLNAFLAAPDSTLTNRQLAQLPGVKAFHQRLSDLNRYGYVVTPAVTLRKGTTAYKLVGALVNRPAMTRRPQADVLPALHDGDSDYARADGVRWIKANRDVILERDAATPAPAASRVDAAIDAAAAHAASILADGLGKTPDPDDPRDVLALAERAREDLIESQIAGGILAEALNDELSLAGPRDGRDLTDLARRTRDEIEAAYAERDHVVNQLRDALVDAGAPAADLTTAEILDAVIDRIQKPRPTPSSVAPTARQPRTPTPEGLTGPGLIAQVLADAGVPLHSDVITKRVLDRGGDAYYKGRTPDKTIRGFLLRENDKSNGAFVKVAPGCYAPRGWPPEKLNADPIRNAG